MKPLVLIVVVIVLALVAYHYWAPPGAHPAPSAPPPPAAQTAPSASEADLPPGLVARTPASSAAMTGTVASAERVPAPAVRPIPLSPAQVCPAPNAEATVLADGVVRLRMTSAEWNAGLRILPPAGRRTFDFSDAFALAVDVENVSPDRQMRLTLHLSSGNESDSADHATAILKKNRSINTGIALNPGEKGTMRIRLPHPSVYGGPTGVPCPYLIDTAHVNPIELKMQWPYEEAPRPLVDCRISGLRLEGVPDHARHVDSAVYCPFIDKYGQFVHAEWPEKVHADAELARDLADERATLRPPPEAWDRFGGWAAGPRLAATGSFRTQKVGGKWFLVTPEGHLFWSFGIDVVRNVTDASNATRHPDWYVSKAEWNMPFSDWNLRKKFGRTDYLDEYYDFTLRRFDSWAINTIGNWSARELMLKGRKPYALSVFELDRSIPRAGTLKFYDCFNEAFETSFVAAVAAKFRTEPILAESAHDPMCIGYFVDNELALADLARKVLKMDARTCAAKRAFLAFGRRKYGTPARLNAAWQTSVRTWADLTEISEVSGSAEFNNDARLFETEWLTRYFRTVRAALHAVSPKMYLGCRFVGFRQPAHLWSTAAKFCDVITVNTYANSVFNVPTDLFAGSPVEKPLLIGEFHFGTLDRGMFKAGLCPVADQAERARALTRFVQGALCHPSLVGCHWFQYRDQPLIGRGDGEAYQIGFVDGCDRPYRELADAARRIGASMYTYRLRGQPVNDMK